MSMADAFKNLDGYINRFMLAMVIYFFILIAIFIVSAIYKKGGLL